MYFFGENYFKPDMDQIKKFAGKFIELDDIYNKVYWLVIYDDEMYFLYNLYFD
jgi:hypothetical protein